MVMRVQMVEGEYRLVLSPAMMAALELTDGAAVEVCRADGLPGGDAHRTAGIDEALAAFERVEPLYRDSLQELASK